MPNSVRVRLRAWQRQAARSLTQATGQQAPWTSISGSNSYQFRQFSNAVPGPDFTEPDKKVCNMIGESTSRLMSRPRLKVRAVPSINSISRSSDCLCSHQPMGRPAQSAINMPAATGPKIWPKFKTPSPISSTAPAGNDVYWPLTSDSRPLMSDSRPPIFQLLRDISCSLKMIIRSYQASSRQSTHPR